MNLAQLIDAEAAQRARYAQPRQHGKVLGVITHGMDRASDRLAGVPPGPGVLIARPETQAAARRVLDEAAIDRARRRAQVLQARQVEADQARAARKAKRKARLAAKRTLAQQQKRLAKLASAPRKARRRVPRAVNHQIMVQVLRKGPLAYRELVAAYNAARRARSLAAVTDSPAKHLLYELRDRGVVVVTGDARHFLYGLGGGAE